MARTLGAVTGGLAAPPVGEGEGAGERIGREGELREARMLPLAEPGGLGAFGCRRFHTACIITRRVHQTQALFASAKIEHDAPRENMGPGRRSGTEVLATYLNLFRKGWVGAGGTDRQLSKIPYPSFQLTGPVVDDGFKVK